MDKILKPPAKMAKFYYLNVFVVDFSQGEASFQNLNNHFFFKLDVRIHAL